MLVIPGFLVVLAVGRIVILLVIGGLGYLNHKFITKKPPQ